MKINPWGSLGTAGDLRGNPPRDPGGAKFIRSRLRAARSAKLADLGTLANAGLPGDYAFVA